MTNEQMLSYLFIQVASQDICFIEKGDITFPPGETERRIQTRTHVHTHVHTL